LFRLVCRPSGADPRICLIPRLTPWAIALRLSEANANGRRTTRRGLTGTLLVAVLMLASNRLHAQDPFEIQIYEYPTVPKGMWNLETHLNYVAEGTKSFEGSVAPTNSQSHVTFELTRGLTEHFELAGYLVLAHRAGHGPEYVSWRVRPRLSLPQSWRLPLDVSISTEVGFPRQLYDENATTLEIRPILEKTVGRFQLDFNPAIGRALRGPGTKEGWDFEPGARFAYALTRRFEPSLEYYGAIGPLGNVLPTNQQVHQFFPGGDLKIGENIVWNFGVGIGLTHAGNRLVYKARIGILFGRKQN